MTHLTVRPFSHLLAGCLTAIAAAGSAAAAELAPPAAEELAPPAAEELAPPAPWYERAVQRVKSTWKEGQPELYLPLYTYHLPFAYTQEKIDSYDKVPLGLGIGKGVYDQAGDWHGLYVMGFHDSHYKPGYIAGYGYKTYWHLSEELKFGLGYTIFLTTREDFGHYIPVPGALPIVSLEYQKFSLDTAYVPGGQGFGNILFFWGKMRF